LLTLGLQEFVGSDYQSYLTLVNDTFRTESIKNSGEILFYFLLIISRKLGNAQWIFLLSALIEVIFFTLILFELKKKGYKLYIIFFLFFTLSLVFFNTFNGIRQYIAVYIVIYALIKLEDSGNLKAFLLICLAGLFHRSAFFTLLIFLLVPILKKN